MRAYSEAPWRIEREESNGDYGFPFPENYDFKIVDGSGRFVCFVDPKNMPVISAAPEMLEFLEEVVPMLANLSDRLAERGITLIKKAKEILP